MEFATADALKQFSFFLSLIKLSQKLYFAWKQKKDDELMKSLAKSKYTHTLLSPTPRPTYAGA